MFSLWWCPYKSIDRIGAHNKSETEWYNIAKYMDIMQELMCPFALSTKKKNGSICSLVGLPSAYEATLHIRIVGVDFHTKQSRMFEYVRGKFYMYSSYKSYITIPRGVQKKPKNDIFFG